VVAERRNVQIVVVRVTGGWCAEIPHLRARRSARTLTVLDQQVRELLSPDEADYRFRTGDPVLDRLVRGVRDGRRAARAAEDHARDLTARVIARATRLTSRDLAMLVELSHQRVHQLRRHTNTDG
jgi:hypothetical protein